MNNLASKRIAIIGAGASGCLCAYFLLKKGFDVTLFDKGSPLRTLLPTGGGRCNLAHSEFDFRELVKNYPRGEKFLFSIFSRFSTAGTLEVFEEMGIKTYTQENGRIFPESNSSKAVREIILSKIKKSYIVQEKVVDIKRMDSGFNLKTSKSEYYFSHVIFALGGHSGCDLVKKLGINVIEQRPSLVGLNTKDDYAELSGTVLKSVSVETLGLNDDLLFTHFGVSGPLVYTISSLKAFDKMPYELEFDLSPNLVDLQKDLDAFPHKEIKNILHRYLPQKIVSYILKDLDETVKAHQVNAKIRDLILRRIHNFKIIIDGVNKGEETVSAGGIDLNEVNAKTMELKKISNAYAIGEILNIDGLCGGFNLQNAWSTAYICAEGII